MADEIRVNTETLEQVAARLAEMASAMESLQARVNGISLTQENGRNVRIALSGVKLRSVPCSLRDGDADECLRSIASALGRLELRTNRAAGAVQDTAEAFEEVERSLTKAFGGMEIPETWLNSVYRALGIDAVAGSLSEEERSWLLELLRHYHLVVDADLGLLVGGASVTLIHNMWQIAKLEMKYMPGRLETTYQASLPGGFLGYEQKRAAGLMDKLSFKSDSLKSERPEYGDHFKRGQSDGDTKISDKWSLLRVGTESSESFSLLNLHTEGENGNNSYEAELNVGKLEGHANFEMGLYSYKVGKDGQPHRVLSPGASVDMGASYTLLEGSASGEYELIDDVKLTGGVKAEAGKVEAIGKGEVGIIDGQLVIKGDLGAEAIAAGVEGKAGVDAFGLKGTVKGSVDIGIGAHAKAGYKDGKLYVDAGAYLGVGGSVSIELDVGDALEKVGKGLENVGKGMSKCAEDFLEGAGDFFGGLW